MPYSELTTEQLLALLEEYPRIMRDPGVSLVNVEWLDSKRTQLAVVATIYAGSRQAISRLPVTVAGLPVIVKVEDPYTARVVEIIDPRENGGTWPRTNRDGSVDL